MKFLYIYIFRRERVIKGRWLLKDYQGIRVSTKVLAKARFDQDELSELPPVVRATFVKLPLVFVEVQCSILCFPDTSTYKQASKH